MPALLAAYGQSRPYIGLVKTDEAKDFEFCRGFLNAEIGQRWLPISQGGLTNYSFFIDIRSDRPGYFLFEGGSLYQILKFEIKTAPEYATRVLERSRDDRYVEVIHFSPKSADLYRTASRIAIRARFREKPATLRRSFQYKFQKTNAKRCSS